jgi:NADH-quinone oxidoreductase subunit G
MFPHARAKQIARSAAAGFKQRTAVSAAEIEKADFLLLLGLDPVNEAPALALSLRQAVRGGAGAAVLDPRPVSLPFAFDHLPVPARHLESGLGALVKQAFANRELDGDPEAEAFRQALPDSAPGCEPHTLQTLGDRLARSERPVLLTGPDILPGAAPGFAAECARFLASALGGCGFFPVLPGPNAFGAALLDFLPGRGAEDLVAAMEQGEVKALLVAEADPLSAFPDRDRLHRALGSLELLCVLDYLPSETVGLADVLLPVRTVFEQEASFVSQAGDVRFARKVHEGGLPLDQAAGGGHPPREFSAAIPGGAPEPGWRVLADLGRRLGLRHAQSEGEGRELAAEELGFPLTDAAARAGLSALSRGGAGFPSSGEPDPPAGGFDLDVLCVDLTFGTEELSSYSPVLRDFAPAPFVLLHTSDAERVSLQDGQTVSLSLTAGRLRAELRTTRGMAPGTLIVPRLAGWPWQMLATGTRIDLRCIQAARTDRPGQGGDPE